MPPYREFFAAETGKNRRNRELTGKSERAAILRLHGYRARRQPAAAFRVWRLPFFICTTPKLTFILERMIRLDFDSQMARQPGPEPSARWTAVADGTLELTFA
jgi:hypothetical protein